MSDSSPIHFPEKDIPLRDDVRVYGALLGDILRDQEGEAFYELVEGIRLASRKRRSGDVASEDRLSRLVQGLEPEDAVALVRAYSAYFHLVNLAEQVHRLRRGRDYLRDEDNPQPGSIVAVLKALKAKGYSSEQIRPLIEELSLQPVFTAHPTEATRRTILNKDRRITEFMIDRSEQNKVLPFEDRRALERIKVQTSIAWQTEEHPSYSPKVSDEVEHVCFYLSGSIYKVLPSLYEGVIRAFGRVFPDAEALKLENANVRFATWVGGDMDGNPNVGGPTIRSTLKRQKTLILRRYKSEIQRLFNELSHAVHRISLSEAFEARLKSYRNTLVDTVSKLPSRYQAMPYRLFLACVSERLEQSERSSGEGYEGPDELESDLKVLAQSLSENKGAQSGLFLVERLIRRVQTFGFHLATLDLRQDALVHRRVVGRLLGHDGFENLSADDRTAILEEALLKDVPERGNPRDPEVLEILDVMDAIKESRASHGVNAIGPYIISMAQGPDDVLALLLIARIAGLRDDHGETPLDITPLFETVDDLEAAPSVLKRILGNKTYRSHLHSRNERQIIMLGYSDSNKESGIVAARWSLQKAQRLLQEEAESRNLVLNLFHGRGGTVSRGGGKTREAVLASPPGTVHGDLRLTEQGEIIHAKYGITGIALRTMELMCGSVVEASIGHEDSPAHAEWVEVMTALSEKGRESYRNLIFDDPDFYAYFRAATPIDVIERLQIGSRPPSRRSGSGIGDLRAIPWVFSWTQSRHILPGWYGVGTALKSLIERFGIEKFREMDREWPFFRTLLSDIEMVLAKADMDIASHYAELAGACGVRVFGDIRSEYQRTVSMITELRQSDGLLCFDPVLERAIKLRNPYVDPMSLVQVDLLRRWRASDRSDQDLEHALFATVRGVARGLQNTG